MKLSKEEYLEKCKECLDYFNINYTRNTMYLTSGGNSCICNPNSQFIELFGGHSLNSITEYVAKELGKKVEWID